ncbi:pilus assembly protein TadG-related protein [Zavarzinia sp.]|uniref:pilus assembly protein TadG-related protein n=1 Tax=Zavarzinia sp. TaxID=2027920 RepID=UPI003BB4C54C
MAALLLVACLVPIAGMVALIIDAGFAYYSKQRLQDALDLAAVAAVSELKDDAGSEAAAISAAQAVLDFNYQSLGEHLTVASGCGGGATPGQVQLCLGNFEARDQNGALKPLADRFTANGIDANALSLEGRSRSPGFFSQIFNIDGLDVAGRATAVKAGSPVAQLTISSTLLKTHKGLVNQVLGVLGGNASLNFLGANGIANAEVNLLGFLDALALSIGVSAGDYDAVLDSPIRIGDFLAAAATTVGSDTTTGLELSGLNSGNGFSADVRALQFRLSDLVSAQTGMNAVGLDFDMSLFEIVYSALLVAHSNHAVSGAVEIDPATVSGFPFLNMGGANATISIRFTIVEPPQISAVGNPAVVEALSDADRKDVSRGGIFVRTAQIRLYIRIDIPALATLSKLLTDMAAMASPLAPVLTSAVGLNFVGSVQSLLNLLSNLLFIGTRTEQRELLDIQLLTRSEGDGRPPGLDIVVDVGGASAYVTGYGCPPTDAAKSLDVQISSQAASLRVGRISDVDAIFSSTTAPHVEPLSLLDIGSKLCTTTKTCLTALLCSQTYTCDSRVAMKGGGLGLYLDTDILGTVYPVDVFANPPDVGSDTAGTCYKGNAPPPPYCEHPRKNEQGIIASVKSTLAGAHFHSYKPDGHGSVLNVLISAADSVIGTTVTNLQPILSSVSGIMDPLVNHLLNALAIGVANVDVGARLTCTTGGRLVR